MGILVVGMKLNPECRERLTWIVARLTVPGDHVIAVHVLQPSSSSSSALSSPELDPLTKHELDETFQGVLGVYQGLCTLKQIKLDIKVVVGASVKEALVDAAKLEDATKLILGTSRFLPTGLSTSLAKYCLKRLSSSCSVTIVDRGKVVFEKPGYRTPGTEATCSKTCTTGMKKLNCGSSPDSPLSVLASPDKPSSLQVLTSLSSSASASSSLGDEEVASPQHFGWPLRAFSLDKVSSSPSRMTAERELSVVSWALKIPNRSTQTSHTSLVANSLLAQRLDDLCSKNSACISFSLPQLQEATSNFSPRNLVGKGGCSQVYKGVLPNGQAIAVKCLNKLTPDTENELVMEVETLSTLRHRNIVALLGYCVSGHHRMVVYNLATNGNLEQILHGTRFVFHTGEDSKLLVLDWPSRQRIALGSAEALEYLHDGCPRPVVHRDVKSSNILLSSNYDPLLCDFGLAKWAPTTAPHITCTDVVGTFGYLAPEYFMFGKLNEKTDVYSFGVVLLELITGKHPIINGSNPKAHENLVTWGRPLLEAGDVDKLADPRLDNNYDKRQMSHMILAAALCLRQTPQLRPRMRRITRLLSGEEESWEIKEEQYCILGDDNVDDVQESDFDVVRRHLALAMVGVDDDIASDGDQSSIDFGTCKKSLEDYLGGRFSWS